MKFICKKCGKNVNGFYAMVWHGRIAHKMPFWNYELKMLWRVVYVVPVLLIMCICFPFHWVYEKINYGSSFWGF